VSANMMLRWFVLPFLPTALFLFAVSPAVSSAVEVAGTQERGIAPVPTKDPCTMPNHSLHLTDDGSVYYNSSTLVAGFQFNVDGATVVSAGGGHAEAAGFTIPTGGNTVLGFSLDGSTISGCGALMFLELDGDATGLSGIIMSDAKGEAILPGR